MAMEYILKTNTGYNTYRNWRINSLDVALFHQNLPRFRAQRLDLGFLYDLASSQLLNLSVKVTAVTHLVGSARFLRHSFRRQKKEKTN